MNIGRIAYKVAKYLQQSRTSFIDDAGDDLIINALNNARLNAERIHDFAPQQARVGLSVDPVNGGDVVHGSFLMNGDELSATSVSVKSVDTAYLQDTNDKGNWYPLMLDSKRLLAKKAKEQNYKFRGNPTQYGYSQYRDTPLTRYAADVRSYLSSRPYRAYWQGDFVFMDPRPTLTQIWIFDAQLWMNSYVTRFVTVASASTASTSVVLAYPNTTEIVTGTTTLLGQIISTVSADGLTLTLAGNANVNIVSNTILEITSIVDPEDWMCKWGADFLMWAAICEVNMFTNTFVTRQDGFSPPPEKARDNAFATMVTNDDYKFELGSEPYLLK